MSEIPDDIMSAAREAYHRPFRASLDSAPVIEVVSSIARALLAERERCAKIAEDFELVGDPRRSPGSETDAWNAGQELASREISRAVRGEV